LRFAFGLTAQRNEHVMPIGFRSHLVPLSDVGGCPEPRVVSLSSLPPHIPP
jgi:hypothetical protein